MSAALQRVTRARRGRAGGERARADFVVLNLRLLAVELRGRRHPVHRGRRTACSTSSATSATTSAASSPAPETVEKLWLALAFAYMVVITGICLVVQADVLRYRPLPPRPRRRQDRLVAGGARLLRLRLRRLHLPAQLSGRRIPRRGVAPPVVDVGPDRGARGAFLKGPPGARCRRASGLANRQTRPREGRDADPARVRRGDGAGIRAAAAGGRARAQGKPASTVTPSRSPSRSTATWRTCRRATSGRSGSRSARSNGCRSRGGSAARASTPARTSCADSSAPACPFAGDLLLLLKVVAGSRDTATTRRVRAAVGYEMRCESSNGRADAERTTAGAR